MNNLNIPEFRAKKISSDEYVIGWLLKDTILCDIDNDLSYPFKIDQTTLAIHFPDMLDSQGNKIFASLSESGKGGDIFTWDNNLFIVWLDSVSLRFNGTNIDNFECDCHDILYEWYNYKTDRYDLKIIGIQK